MKRKILLSCLLLFTTVFLTGCTKTVEDDPVLEDYVCKNTPLDTSCFKGSEALDHISSTPQEYLISEDFETDFVNQMPRNWLLYRNQEYAINGVIANVVVETDNQFVELYSDGLRAPAYPQSAPNPTFIFTTKFNLDQTKAGIAYGSLMIPSDKQSTTVTFGVSTGSVNTISVTIEADMKLSVKVGGPFFYYSGSGDGGDVHQTSYSLNKDEWYKFKLEWDEEDDMVAAYIMVNNTYESLFDGNFHISNRVNALADGMILVPNVVKITMPRYQSGWAYLDNVSVERRGE